MMDNGLLDEVLEIKDYLGDGYQPLVDYGEWRVAMLRFLDAIQPDRVDMMERHLGSDEVFVLLTGKGVLIMGGNGKDISAAIPAPMQPGIIYNVKAASWHTVLLSRDAKVLIVENRNVDVHNSEYKPIPAEMRPGIFEIAQKEGIS